MRALLWFLVHGLLLCTAKATTTQRYRRNEEDAIICMLSINAVLNEDGSHDEFYSCSLLVNESLIEGTYSIEPPQNIFGEHKELLLRGQEIEMHILGGIVTEDEVLLPDTAVAWVASDTSGERRLARKPSTLGSFTAVMIRISTDDSEPDFSEAILYNYLFEADLSVKNQFERCSGNALTMLPDPNLGVIDIRLSTTTSGKSNKALMNLAEVRVNEEYGPRFGFDSIRDHADALMFVVPPGTGTWAAFATVSGKSSAYNNRWGGYLGAVMHELGHNLGLRHAFQNGKEYEDRSGYMGSAPQQVLYPQRCKLNRSRPGFLVKFAPLISKFFIDKKATMRII